jgi:hypothetical protein
MTNVEETVTKEKTAKNEETIKKEETANKTPYQEPRVIDYGTIADLTKKPGSRGDGSPGTKGNKGMGG